MSEEDITRDFPFTPAALLLSEEVHVEVQGEVSPQHLCGLSNHLISSLLQSQDRQIFCSFLCIGECGSSLAQY